MTEPEFSACADSPPDRLQGWPSEFSKFEIRNSKSSEAGYTLVVFVMIVAVMAILMAVAVEIVSFQAQREREAELFQAASEIVRDCLCLHGCPSCVGPGTETTDRAKKKSAEFLIRNMLGIKG